MYNKFHVHKLFCARLTITLAAALGTTAWAEAPARSFTVNSNDDYRHDGCSRDHCNLREAIEAANHSNLGGRIVFALPHLPWRIEPLTALPALTGNVWIVGESQPGVRCPNPGVELSGAALAGTSPGLHLRGDYNRVSGLAIREFAAHGLHVQGSRNVLECLVVGSDAAGMRAAGNRGHGVLIDGGVGNRVGAQDAERGNLISANGGWPIRYLHTLDVSQANNRIGVDATGAAVLPNGYRTFEQLEVPVVSSPWASNPRIQARVAQIIAINLELIEASAAASIPLDTLYRTWLEALQASDPRGDHQPRDLDALVRELGAFPELLAGFSAEFSAYVQAADSLRTPLIEALVARYGRLSPALGRDAPSADFEDNELIEALFGASPPASLVVGGPSQGVVDPNADGTLPQLTPLFFRLLQVAGSSVCQPSSICEWPVGYDLVPNWANVVWNSTTLSQSEVNTIVQEQDTYVVRLYLNGALLDRYDPGNPGTPLPDYYLFSLPAQESAGLCPMTHTCVMATLNAASLLASHPLPWHFDLRVYRDESIPPKVVLDENGNPVVVSTQQTLFSRVEKTVAANGVTGHLSYFAEQLYPTFQHPRCTSCHAFNTIEALGNTPYHSGTPIQLQPSAYVPGAHVMTCANCHEASLPQTFLGDPFHETAWKAPYFDLDVDWSTKSAIQTCARVKANLPTPELRTEHFHEDARLFWAVTNPVAPIVGSLGEPAPPGDWLEFLERVDRWNTFNAPCP